MENLYSTSKYTYELIIFKNGKTSDECLECQYYSTKNFKDIFNLIRPKLLHIYDTFKKSNNQLEFEIAGFYSKYSVRIYSENGYNNLFNNLTDTHSTLLTMINYMDKHFDELDDIIKIYNRYRDDKYIIKYIKEAFDEINEAILSIIINK